MLLEQWAFTSSAVQRGKRQAHAAPAAAAGNPSASRLLVLHYVRLGQRLDSAHKPRSSVPCQADAPKAAGAQHAPHLKVLQPAGLKLEVLRQGGAAPWRKHMPSSRGSSVRSASARRPAHECIFQRSLETSPLCAPQRLSAAAVTVVVLLATAAAAAAPQLPWLLPPPPPAPSRRLTAA